MTRDEFLEIWLCSSWRLLLTLGRCWIAGTCSSLCRAELRLYDISKLAFQRQCARPIQFCMVIAKCPLLSGLHVVVICTSLQVPLLVGLMLQDILSGGGPKKHFGPWHNLCWDSLQSASRLCRQLVLSSGSASSWRYMSMRSIFVLLWAFCHSTHNCWAVILTTYYIASNLKQHFHLDCWFAIDRRAMCRALINNNPFVAVGLIAQDSMLAGDRGVVQHNIRICTPA